MLRFLDPNYNNCFNGKTQICTLFMKHSGTTTFLHACSSLFSWADNNIHSENPHTTMHTLYIAKFYIHKCIYGKTLLQSQLKQTRIVSKYSQIRDTGVAPGHFLNSSASVSVNVWPGQDWLCLLAARLSEFTLTTVPRDLYAATSLFWHPQ